MKAISPMIATVLLIGFTIAVGAILSLWFTTFTRTQTTGVQAGAACVSNAVYARAIAFNSTSGATTLLVANGGPDSITVNSVIMTCGGTMANSTNPSLFVGINTQNITTILPASGVNCSQSNIGFTIIAACTKGGTTTTGCPEGTCFS
jgi:flagellin-like protein